MIMKNAVNAIFTHMQQIYRTESILYEDCFHLKVPDNVVVSKKVVRRWIADQARSSFVVLCG